MVMPRTEGKKVSGERQPWGSLRHRAVRTCHVLPERRAAWPSAAGLGHLCHLEIDPALLDWREVDGILVHKQETVMRYSDASRKRGESVAPQRVPFSVFA